MSVCWLVSRYSVGLFVGWFVRRSVSHVSQKVFHAKIGANVHFSTTLLESKTVLF